MGKKLSGDGQSVQSPVTPDSLDPMDCSVHHQLPELARLMSIQAGDAFGPSHPLSSPFPPGFSHSSIRVFLNESLLHIRWPKNWSFSVSISPSNEYLGLISFRMDQFDHVVQRTLKSLLQHDSSKASVLHAQPSLQIEGDHFGLRRQFRSGKPL